MDALFSYFARIYPLSPPAVEAVSRLMEVQPKAKNTLLQPIGHTCRTIYFIQKGAARIFYYKDGNDVTEYFAFEGDMIVRAESLFAGKPSPKGIEILEDARVVAIPSAPLFALYDQFHDIERLFRLLFEQEYVKTVKRVESLQFHTAKERYLALLEATDLVNRIPLRHIASYLGITQVSLSRIRHDLA